MGRPRDSEPIRSRTSRSPAELRWVQTQVPCSQLLWRGPRCPRCGCGRIFNSRNRLLMYILLIYIYVCVCVNDRVCVYVYIYVCVCEWSRMCVCIYIYVCVCVWMIAYVCMYIYMCVCDSIGAYALRMIYNYMCIYIYITNVAHVQGASFLMNLWDSLDFPLISAWPNGAATWQVLIRSKLPWRGWMVTGEIG